MSPSSHKISHILLSVTYFTKLMYLSEFVYEIISAYILSKNIYPKYQGSSKFTIKKKKPKQNKIKGK
ncbi:hypothetical protein PRUPE_1G540300 [Prunus persica]|uniref:Uncharacterized protein n=1 Tax=Prunus persica TaxID=3760 RepID=M5XF51_PRUPE|nr:hypothetical protein PRUPE_1G540300 [Prunus persica]